MTPETPAEILQQIDQIRKTILAGQIVVLACWTILLVASIQISIINRKIRKAQGEINSILDMRLTRMERAIEEMMRR